MLGIKDIVRCPYCNKLYEHDFGRILSYEYNGRTVVHDLGHGCGPFVCETFRHLNARKCKEANLTSWAEKLDCKIFQIGYRNIRRFVNEDEMLAIVIPELENYYAPEVVLEAFKGIEQVVKIFIECRRTQLYSLPLDKKLQKELNKCESHCMRA